MILGSAPECTYPGNSSVESGNCPSSSQGIEYCSDLISSNKVKEEESGGRYCRFCFSFDRSAKELNRAFLLDTENDWFPGSQKGSENPTMQKDVDSHAWAAAYYEASSVGSVTDN